MYRKILTLVLAALMIFSVGCGKEKPKEEKPTVSVESEPKVVYYKNPLTGEENLLSKEDSEKRPVAIMINNISNAQRVQTGVNKADIVYETEVEGGITRMMAVYQDISKVEKIGTVRSARYVYIDLAMGHKAIYAHHGQDSYHAAPHLKDTQTIVIDSNSIGARIKNGEKTEHTLYAFGDKVWQRLIDKGYDTKITDPTDWQQFADSETKVSFTDSALTVNVPFSSGYKSVFKYDQAKGKYVRYFKTTERKDYITGESTYFKNLFVLVTSISKFANCNDGYKHQNVVLTSGTGYYCVNGTYTPIRWSKGAASSSFVFTTLDGAPLTVSQGNSYVGIMGKNFAPSFEGTPETTTSAVQ